MKIHKNSGRSFDNSAVRKQYSAGKFSVNDFSAIRRDSRFISRPNAMSPAFLSAEKKKLSWCKILNILKILDNNNWETYVISLNLVNIPSSSSLLFANILSYKNSFVSGRIYEVCMCVCVCVCHS